MLTPLPLSTHQRLKARVQGTEEPTVLSPDVLKELEDDLAALTLLGEEKRVREEL